MRTSSRSDTDRIDSISRALARLPETEAVVLFGSRARGSETEESDIDLLLVCAPRTRQREYRRLARSISAQFDSRASISTFTYHGFRRQCQRRPHFAAHLSHESLVLYQSRAAGTVSQILKDEPATPDGLRAEIRRECETLKVFDPVERFDCLPVVPLSHIYAIARTVVVTTLLLNGVVEFDQTRGFAAVKKVLPMARSEVAFLEQLRPLHDYVRHRRCPEFDPMSISPRTLDRALEAAKVLSREALV